METAIKTARMASSAETRRPFDLATYPMFFLAHILERHVELMAGGLRPAPFDNSTWRVLATLQYKDGLTIKELSLFSVVERSFVSRVVARLEREGLVRRQGEASDRRKVLVFLTEEGLRVFQEVFLPVTRKQMEMIFAGVSPEEMRIMFSILDRAMKNVYAAGGREPPL